MQQLHVPPLTRVNKTLIIGVVAFFLIYSIGKVAGFNLLPIMGLTPGMVLKGHVYQFITYPFLTPSLMGLVFEALLLWFLGSELERVWGEKIYIKFMACSALGAGLIYFILSVTVFKDFVLYQPLFGLSGIGYALCLAYAIIFSERYLTFMLIFPMKAKWFCTIMIAILLYTGIFSPGAKASWGHLAAMATGFLYLKYKANKSSQKSSSFANNFLKKKKKQRDSSHLKLIKNDDDDQNPTYH